MLCLEQKKNTVVNAQHSNTSLVEVHARQAEQLPAEPPKDEELVKLLAQSANPKKAKKKKAAEVKGE